MKNLIFGLLLVLFLAACTNPNAYDLKGSTDEPQWNGMKVFLYGVSDASGLTALDSTSVENNSFEIKGVVDTAGWYVLMLKPENGQAVYKDFYVGGSLDCSLISGKIRITGSHINDAYQAFEDQYAVLSASLTKLNTVVKSDPQNESAKEAFNAAYVTFLKSFRELSKKTIVENMDNPLGIHILQAALSSLENSDLEDLLSKASPKFLKDKTVMMVKDQLEMSKRVQVGSKCPDLKMMSPEGAPMFLSEYLGKGHYVLIDFWASWCGPCMNELPNVLKCYDEYHSKGFDIVGISLDEDATAWKGAIRKNKIPWHHMSDLAGWKSQAVFVFSFSSIPHTVLVDQKGIIIAKDLRGEELQAKLKALYR